MKDCLTLASELELNYLIHNASVYLWNYAQKLRISGNMSNIPMMFTQAFECLTKKTELAPDLIIQMANVLANSPLIEIEEKTTMSTGGDSVISGKRSKTPEKKASRASSKKASKSRLSAQEQQKKSNLLAALDICERAIESTRSAQLQAQSLIELARNWLRQRLELARLNNENVQVQARVRNRNSKPIPFLMRIFGFFLGSDAGIPNFRSEILFRFQTLVQALKIGVNPLKTEEPLVYIWLSLDLYYFGYANGGPSLVELSEIIEKTHKDPEVLIGQTPLIISAYRYLACICLNSNTEFVPLARSSCEAALKMFEGSGSQIDSRNSVLFRLKTEFLRNKIGTGFRLAFRFATLRRTRQQCQSKMLPRSGLLSPFAGSGDQKRKRRSKRYSK